MKLLVGITLPLELMLNHARVFGNTLVHEFPISYSHTSRLNGFNLLVNR